MTSGTGDEEHTYSREDVLCERIIPPNLIVGQELFSPSLQDGRQDPG